MKIYTKTIDEICNQPHGSFANFIKLKEKAIVDNQKNKNKLLPKMTDREVSEMLALLS